MRFLTHITASQMTSADELSPAEKTDLANKLLELIMNDEAAFVEIMMANISSILSVCQLSIPNIRQRTMTKTLDILSSNENARIRLIKTVDDIEMLCSVNSASKNPLLQVLLQTNHLRNLVKNNAELCQAINRYPLFPRFFLMCMIKDQVLFNTLLDSEADWNKIKQTMQSVKSFSPREEAKIREMLNTKLSKSTAPTVWEKERPTFTRDNLSPGRTIEVGPSPDRH